MPTGESKAQCIARATSSAPTLYSNLKELIGNGANEDLGRYVGYGWRPFQKLRISSLLPSGCISIYPDARALCEKVEAVSTADSASMIALLANMPQTPRVIEWQASLK